MGEEVGVGGFGSVHKAHHRQTGQYHAVKVITKSKDVTIMNQLWSEMDIMKQLDHPHIMRMYNTFEDDAHLYISSELCVGGPFFDTLRSVKAGHLWEADCGKLFRQIIGVTSYLHSRSICHRDIKPENFLVLRPSIHIGQLHLKLIDFGTAKRFDLLSMVTKVCTPHYVAPEVLSPKNQSYTEKVDVWSCGVMLFVMLCGRLPFHKDDNMELLKLVRKGKFEFEPSQVWKDVSENAHDLIKKILCVNVQDRCTADQAFHHPWCDLKASDEEADKGISKQMIGDILRFFTNNRLKRVALRIIARQIDDGAIESQRSVWLSVDTDNSGTLTLDEMNKAVMRLDVSDMTRAGMIKIICHLDPTGSGIVEYTEFLAACLNKQQYMQEQVCRAAFVRLDFDCDGIVSRKDLGRLLSDKDGMRDAGLTGASLCELIDELENIMNDADGNNDGGVSFEEFMELMDDEGHLPWQTAVSLRTKRPAHANYARALKQFLATDLVDVAPDADDDEAEESS